MDFFAIRKLNWYFKRKEKKGFITKIKIHKNLIKKVNDQLFEVKMVFAQTFILSFTSLHLIFFEQIFLDSDWGERKSLPVFELIITI